MFFIGLDEAEVREKSYILFAAFLLLLFAAGVYASPVVADVCNLSLSVVSSNESTQVQLGSELFSSMGFSDSRLAEIGKELFKPPVDVAASVTSTPLQTKSLPAIPATFFMVLTGFLCVSLVKDRRLWLTVAFGVLYLGVAGVNVFPRLLSNPENVKIKQFSPKGILCEFKNFVRPESQDQGIKYMGLLRRVTAIPGDESFTQNHEQVSNTAHCLDVLIARSLYLASAASRLYSHLSAIMKFYNPQLSLACSYVRTQNWIRPSQAFISFKNLPHGPPYLQKNSCLRLFEFI